MSQLDGRPLTPGPAAAGDDRAGELGFPGLSEQVQGAMNGETLRQTVVITNPQGFHMRPLTAFVELARQFQSSVTVTKEGQRSNGKSPLELMTLGAEQGTELEIEATGPDARQALDALVKLIASLGQEEAPDTPLPNKG